MNNKTKPVMLITGAASGLGKALAEQAIKTHRVVISDINQKKGQAVADALWSQGGHATFIACDVSDPKQVEELIESVKAQMGRLDVVINNAGVASHGDLLDTTDEEWHRLINTNLLSVIRVSRACIPLLKERSNACIVNVASFAALALLPGMASYNVAKAGVLALSETLRAELVHDDIHVVCACPAFFETNLTESMLGVDEAVKHRIKGWMKSSSYTAADVAELILDAVQFKRFLVLADKKSLWQHRISRWFPNYFYRQKMSFYGKLK